MNRRFMVIAAIVCWLFSASPSMAELAPPAVGDEFPEISLAVPENPEHRTYLGLTGKDNFTIPQIHAEVLIIEIFSMYCPHCQREAPVINAFYRKLQTDDRYNQKVKLIGIAAGNSEFEVDHFRKTYDIPFPLFPDADFSIHKKVGEVRTPYFMGVRINKDGTTRVFYSKLGGAKSADALLQMLLDQSGLK